MDGRHRRRRAGMDRVQAAALALFDQRGYPSVTVAEVARAAGVATQSVFNYFGSKAGIVLHGSGDADLLDHVGPLLARGDPLTDALAAALRRHDGADDPVRARERARWPFDEPDVRAAYLVAMDDLAEYLAGLLASRAVHPLPLAESREQAARAVAGMYAGFKHWYLSGSGGHPVDAMVSALGR